MMKEEEILINETPVDYLIGVLSKLNVINVEDVELYLLTKGLKYFILEEMKNPTEESVYMVTKMLEFLSTKMCIETLKEQINNIKRRKVR